MSITLADRDFSDRMPKLITYKVARVYFENGDFLETRINGTDRDIKAYYLGKRFNLGTEEDSMQKCIRVEIGWVAMPEGKR